MERCQTVLVDKVPVIHLFGSHRETRALGPTHGQWVSEEGELVGAGGGWDWAGTGADCSQVLEFKLQLGRDINDGS